MLRKALATIAAAAIMVTAFVVPSADAEKGKKGKRDRQETITVAPSLDRRPWTSRSSARSSGRVGLHIRFLSIEPRLCSALSSDAISR
jgi:hypothetical protein